MNITICAGVEGHRPRLRLASALASFAHDMGAAAIAEGIETPMEAAALEEMGVRYGQGFLLDRPARKRALAPPGSGGTQVSP